MSAGSYAISASLGDLSRPPALSGRAYQFYPGFWSTFSGVAGDQVPVNCSLCSVERPRIPLSGGAPGGRGHP